MKRSQQKNKIGREDYDSLLERLMSMANLLKLRYSLAVSFSPISTSNISKFPALKRVTHISHVWDAACLSFILPQSKKIFFSLSPSRSTERWFSQLHPRLPPSFLPWPPAKADFGEEACFKTRRNDVCFILLTPCLLLLADYLSHMPWRVPSWENIGQLFKWNFYMCVSVCVCV